MQIIEGKTHDPLSATYQVLEIARLNAALKECGVFDAELRRRICESYFFSAGYFIDSCWFQDQGIRVRPGIYFAEIDLKNNPTARIYIPDPTDGTMFHEYAHGNSAWLFEDHAEDASEIEVGDTLSAD